MTWSNDALDGVVACWYLRWPKYITANSLDVNLAERFVAADACGAVDRSNARMCVRTRVGARTQSVTSQEPMTKV